MNNHFIIIGDSYDQKSRVGLWFYNENMEMIDKCIAQIKNSNVRYSTYLLHIDGNTWLDVCKHEPYCSDLKLVDTPKEFIRLVRSDKDLTSADVARYIASQVDCDNYTLKKLLRQCSSEYFRQYSRTLFTNKPFRIQKPLLKCVALQSRICNSENGREKMTVIDEVLRKSQKIKKGL